MKYFKINNLLNTFGQCDYKGIDPSTFVAGSYVTPQDFAYCLMALDGDIATTHPDVVEITDTDYNDQRSTILSQIQVILQTTDQKVSDLQAQNAQMLLALVNGGLM